MKLFICHTYYHVLIALAKKISDKHNGDIYISDTISNANDLSENIEKSKIFENTFVLYETRMNLNHKTSFPLSIIEDKCLIKREIKKTPTNIHKYSEIYIFNDASKVGRLLCINNIPYHLLEDALNSYSYLDNYYTLNRRFLKLKKFLNLALPYGNSKYVIDVEVNDVNKIGSLSHSAIIESPRTAIFLKLNSRERDIIYSIFSKNRITFGNRSKVCLLITQALLKEQLVNNEEEQLMLYKNIIDDCLDKFDNIIIKPHPRDDINYASLSDKIKIVESKVPIEILNFDADINIEKAITISSSSINGIDFCEEKMSLGFDWLSEELIKIREKFKNEKND